MSNNQAVPQGKISGPNNEINHNIELLRSVAFVSEHYNVHHLYFKEEDLSKISIDTVISAAQAAQEVEIDPASAVYPIL